MEQVLAFTFLGAFGALIWATLTDRREIAVVVARLSLLGLLSLVILAVVGVILYRPGLFYPWGWDWPAVLTALAVPWIFWARRYHAGAVRLLLQGAAGVALAVSLVLTVAMLNADEKPVLLNHAKLDLSSEHRVNVITTVHGLGVKAEPAGTDQLLLTFRDRRSRIAVSWEGDRPMADLDTLLTSLRVLYDWVDQDRGYFEHRIHVY